MSATADMITRLRRMVAESGSASYTDDMLSAAIERYPLPDELGAEPYTWSYTSTPPTKTENTWWIDTYDINAAAAEVWQEKAVTLAADFDFSADGASYTRSQSYQQAMNAARHYQSRAATRVIELKPDTYKAPEYVINSGTVD
jgi:hypothetical protein